MQQDIKIAFFFFLVLINSKMQWQEILRTSTTSFLRLRPYL